jgi:hypothetical protein
MPMNMWVKGSGYLQFSIQLIPQWSPKHNDECSLSIRNDAPWKPKEHLNPFKYQACNFLSFDGLLIGHQNTHLVEPI